MIVPLPTASLPLTQTSADRYPCPQGPGSAFSDEYILEGVRDCEGFKLGEARPRSEPPAARAHAPLGTRVRRSRRLDGAHLLTARICVT